MSIFVGVRRLFWGGVWVLSFGVVLVVWMVLYLLIFYFF